MKQSENYYNWKYPPTLRQDRDPRHHALQPQPVHKPNMTHKASPLKGITTGPKQTYKTNKISGTLGAQKPTFTNKHLLQTYAHVLFASKKLFKKKMTN